MDQHTVETILDIVPVLLLLIEWMSTVFSSMTYLGSHARRQIQRLPKFNETIHLSTAKEAIVKPLELHR